MDFQQLNHDQTRVFMVNAKSFDLFNDFLEQIVCFLSPRACVEIACGTIIFQHAVLRHHSFVPVAKPKFQFLNLQVHV
jgi:hypothetical protein